MNTVELDGSLWKNLLILLTTLHKKLEKWKNGQNNDVEKCSVLQTFDIALLLADLLK